MKNRANLLPPVILSDVEEIIFRTKKELKNLEGKSILITGAAGFLTSYLIHTLGYANTHLFKNPINLICLDNFRTGSIKRLSLWKGRSDIKFITKDIIKNFDIKQKIDYIIHAASIASPIWYRKFPLETIDVNVSGTRNLLNLGLRYKVKGFLYLSSSEVYGNPFSKFIPTSEEYFGNVSSLGPRACYDESKRLGETFCMIFYRKFGIPVKIVRPFNVYGPGLRLDDGRVIPDFIGDVLKNRPISILSDGRATRSFCYITDAVVAFLMLLISKKSGEAFNVGNSEEVSILKLAQTLNQISGNKLGVKYFKSKDKAYLIDNPQRRVPNLEKTQHAINWTPNVPLFEGLQRTLKYYKEGAIG